jgi:hypothetical protein
MIKYAFLPLANVHEMVPEDIARALGPLVLRKSKVTDRPPTV